MLCNRWTRWHRLGVFATIMTELAAQVIDVKPGVRHCSSNNWRGHAKAHRTASNLAVQKGRALLSSIPRAGALLADPGHDADWFRIARIEMGISLCIPSRSGRKMPILHDANCYRLRHKINSMFARRKDRCRIATRDDRCPVLFLSACALAATVIH